VVLELLLQWGVQRMSRRWALRLRLTLLRPGPDRRADIEAEHRPSYRTGVRSGERHEAHHQQMVAQRNDEVDSVDKVIGSALFEVTQSAAKASLVDRSCFVEVSFRIARSRRHLGFSHIFNVLAVACAVQETVLIFVTTVQSATPRHC
jgi:hypothetical protein